MIKITVLFDNELHFRRTGDQPLPPVPMDPEDQREKATALLQMQDCRGLALNDPRRFMEVINIETEE